MTSLRGSFDLTLQGLNAGIRVRHIATFQMCTCNIDDQVQVVLTDSQFMNFDQIPVRNKAGKIIGVLERHNHIIGGDVGEAMRQVDVSLLVPEEASLLGFIKTAGLHPYKLVLGEDGINGIITRSDLLKLPVRLLAFSFISQLELTMGNFIRSVIGTEEATLRAMLSIGRQEKIDNKHSSLKRKDMDPEFIELLDLCDKREIISKSKKVPETFSTELKEIENLRNSIAHSGSFIESESDVQIFVTRIGQIRYWIDTLDEDIQKHLSLESSGNEIAKQLTRED